MSRGANFHSQSGARNSRPQGGRQDRKDLRGASVTVNSNNLRLLLVVAELLRTAARHTKLTVCEPRAVFVQSGYATPALKSESS